jgi:hypothetical protein
MKHGQMIVVSLVLCLALALAQATLLASNDLMPPRDREIVHVPHSYECYISVAPAIPTITDTIQVTAGGGWPDTCAPDYTSYQVVSHEVRMNFIVSYSLPIMCLTLITPWGHTIEISDLPKGIYEAKAYLNNWPCASRTFAVLEQVIPLYLPIITKQSDG